MPSLNIDLSKLGNKGFSSLLEKAKKFNEKQSPHPEEEKGFKKAIEQENEKEKDKPKKIEVGNNINNKKYGLNYSKLLTNIDLLQKFSLRLNKNKIKNCANDLIENDIAENIKNDKKTKSEQKPKKFGVDKITEYGNFVYLSSRKAKDKKENPGGEKENNNNLKDDIKEYELSTINLNDLKEESNNITRTINFDFDEFSEEIACIFSASSVYDQSDYNFIPDFNLETKASDYDNEVKQENNNNINNEIQICPPEDKIDEKEIPIKKQTNKNSCFRSLPYYANEYETIKDNYCIKKCEAVIEYSFREDQNIDSRITMEDKSKSIENFNNDNRQILFELFDGYGGDDISNFLQQHFAVTYKKFLDNTRGNIADSLIETFKENDKELANAINIKGKGATATVVHILWTENNEGGCRKYSGGFFGKLMIYTANVGNCKASLISPISISRLTQEDEYSQEEKAQKIISKRRKYLNNKSKNKKGEKKIKIFGEQPKDINNNINNNFLCIPFISQFEVDLKIKNQFLILASDGIWDFVSEQEIQKMICTNKDSEQLCSIIIKQALFKESSDNISIFVVKLT